MVEAKKAGAAIFGVLSCIAACIMVAGTSTDCGIVRTVPWAEAEDTLGGEYLLGTQVFCMKEEDDGPDFKYQDVFGDCKDSGQVVTDVTYALLGFTILNFLSTAVRLGNSKYSAGIVKALALATAIISTVMDIVAVSYFEDKCAGAVEAELSVSMIAGCISTFLLFMVSYIVLVIMPVR